ncbi:Uncharacterised protein [Mycobacteroides abscessus subsp. massiliense]|nr:Uncharacterised protein [Mycobacteroides abscessus subsp. massiliense]
MQLVQHELQVLRIHSCHRDIAARHRSSQTPSGSDDSISNDAMLGGMKLRNTDHTHLDQHGAQVHHVRFTRGVVDGGDAVRENRCHQDVLGRPHGGELKLNISSMQRFCLGDHAPMFYGALRSKLSQSRLVHVEWT